MLLANLVAKCGNSDLLIYFFSSRRDLVALLSAVEPSEIDQHSQLYHAFLEILSQQVTTVERGFFEVSEVNY
jgi:hypothetical protein